MKKLLVLLLLGALPLAPCAAQGTLNNVSRPLLPSDIDALARHADANRRPVTEAQQQSLMATGAIGLEQTYFDPAWGSGTLTLPGGKPLTIGALRLNMLGQVLEVVDPGASGGVRRYPAAEVAGFALGRHEFASLDYRGSAGSGKNFLEVLNPGRVRLLLLHEAQLVPALRNEALAIEIKPAYYQRSTRLFALPPGQAVAQELALTKRQVLRLLGDQNKTIELFATAQHLDYTILDDVVKMVAFYNKQGE